MKEILLIILIVFFGGYFMCRRLFEYRKLHKIISNRESEYSILKSKLITNQKIIEYDEKMSDLKLGAIKYFSIWSNNKNIIDTYDKISNRYIRSLQQEEA